MIEIHLAIICACLPMFRLPLAYILPSYFSSSSSGTNPSGVSSSPSYYSASYNRKSKKIVICPSTNGSSTKDLELQANHITIASSTAASSRTQSRDRDVHHPGTEVFFAPPGSRSSDRKVAGGEEKILVEFFEVSPAPPPRSSSLHNHQRKKTGTVREGPAGQGRTEHIFFQARLDAEPGPVVGRSKSLGG